MQQTMVLSVCGQGSLVAADAKLLCHLCQCGECGSSSFKFEAFLNRGCIEEDGFYFQDREVRDSEDS